MKSNVIIIVRTRTRRLSAMLWSLFLSVLPVASMASVGNDEPTSNWLNVGVGLSDDSWNVELGYIWMPLPWIGIGASLQMDKQNGDGGLLGELFNQTTSNDYTYDDEYIVRFNLIPALTLRSPTLRLTRNTDRGDGLLVQAEPGAMLSLPANDVEHVSLPAYDPPPRAEGIFAVPTQTVRVSNHGGRWLYWRLKTTLGYQLGDGFLGIGYSVSNYSIFDCRRNMQLDGQKLHDFGRRTLAHTVFLTMNVGF